MHNYTRTFPYFGMSSTVGTSVFLYLRQRFQAEFILPKIKFLVIQSQTSTTCNLFILLCFICSVVMNMFDVLSAFIFCFLHWPLDLIPSLKIVNIFSKPQLFSVLNYSFVILTFRNLPMICRISLRERECRKSLWIQSKSIANFRTQHTFFLGRRYA